MKQSNILQILWTIKNYNYKNFKPQSEKDEGSHNSSLRSERNIFITQKNMLSARNKEHNRSLTEAEAISACNIQYMKSAADNKILTTFYDPFFELNEQNVRQKKSRRQ